MWLWSKYWLVKKTIKQKHPWLRDESLCTAFLIDKGYETNTLHLDSHSHRLPIPLNQFASQLEDDGFYCFLETGLL